MAELSPHRGRMIEDNQALLIRWSVQEIRRITVKLAQQHIEPAHVIARSLWRRAHQAEARRAHLKKENDRGRNAHH